MALQTNLSKKDKMTIAIVLFAGVVFAFVWFLIKPTITSIITVSDKIEQAELTQTQYKNKLINLASGEAIYDKTVSDFKDSTSHFYPVMDSSEIDRMVTSYVLKSGLFAEDLTIKMPKKPVEEKPYIYSSLYSSQSRRAEVASITATTTNTSGKKSSTSDSLITPYNTMRASAASTATSGVQCVELTIVVTGTNKTCQALIDDLCTKPAVRITGFAWETVDKEERINETTGNVEFVDTGKVRLRLTVNLYMADIADYETTAGAEG